jgi:CelD/BcsL family acetyltransferase involved in cellulose biosynthesis
LINRMAITAEDFSSLAAYHADNNSNLKWDLVFTLPALLKIWWQSFGSGAELYIRSVRQEDQIIGIAPLQIRNSTASIIGSVDVCDYQDFIVVPGQEREFFETILDDLRQKNIQNLHLETVRPDSAVVTHLMPLAQERHCAIDYRQVDVSADLELPRSWDEYLSSLDSKQRHELRRKMRNLQEAGETAYRTIEEPGAIPEAIENFLKLFPESRGDKALFMTPPMQAFFQDLVKSLAEIGVIRFGVLEIGPRIVSMVMYFDYNGNVYLYNSAYDPAYKSLSVGIISKARCIQDSIERGKKRFDFLKGAEQYKYYLGGKAIPLFSCDIAIR